MGRKKPLTQAFINYNSSCTRFCACKTVLDPCLCAWEIVQVKEQTCTLLVITYGSRNYTKLVLKPLAAKSGLSISILCIAPFLRLYYFSLHDDYPPLYTMQSFYIAALPILVNGNEKQCTEFNILTLDHNIPIQLLFSYCIITPV